MHGDRRTVASPEPADVRWVAARHQRSHGVSGGMMAGTTRRFPMQTRQFPSTPDGRSPAGAEVRYLIEGETGGMIHSTVPAGQVNRATVHATVSEFWHVLSGQGQIWRRDETGEETSLLRAGVSIDIPVGTAFQYRCSGPDPLQFLCITMPPWPGNQESTVLEGPWEPTAPEGW
jgi:mannose-6-phosphate isomerase-like protein (cupin superfamily)